MADRDRAAGRAKRLSLLLPQIAKNLRLAALIESVHRGITTPQLLLLLILDQADHPALTMSELARELGVTLPTATGIVQRLIRQQLVERTHEERDRRLVFVSLTATGRRVIRRLLRRFEDLVVEILAGMSDAEQASVSRSADRIYQLSLRVRQREQQMVRAS